MARKTNEKNRSTKLKVGMRTSLIVSILLHVCVFFAIQVAFPTKTNPKPARTYNVDFLRPPVDRVEEKKRNETDINVKPTAKKPLKQTEDTISLDTRDKKYRFYVKVIRERLMYHWKYPREASDNLLEGEVLILFALNRQGLLQDIRILKPSAFKILDEEAERSIRVTAPFPPFPGSVTVDRLNIRANFRYQLTSGQGLTSSIP
ncbi:MAG: energy transducer TonB, partial [Desulfobacterales bacterium]|nr:energy transducer TonB [Desulfobacterales bacterium]